MYDPESYDPEIEADANEALHEQLIEIVRKVSTLLTRDETLTLCYGCGLDAKQVLGAVAQ